MIGFIKSALLLAGPVLASLPAIEQVGSEFIDSSTKDRFTIVGVDYQPGGSSAFSETADPLSDGSTCLRDAVMMQKLGINTIRVYNVAPTLNHDECMSIFDAAGIYVLLDVNSPLSGQYLDRSDPAGTYDLTYLEHIFSVVENFMDYTNVLGFFSGNEIINTDDTASATPPYIRAVQRDLKKYIAKNAPRTIPVGYSAADVSDVLEDTWLYLQCNNNDNSSSDFFGLNDYTWCGGSATFESSGYADLVTMFEGTAIPIFFSEYGCNNILPRVFDEVTSLYSSNMTVLSGGLVYEWSEETDDYGLVNIYSNATLQLMTDYVNLQDKLAAVDLSVLQSADSTAESVATPTCASTLITASGFNNSFTLPKMPSGGQALINSGVGSSVTAGTFTSLTATSVTQSVYNTAGSLMTNLVLTVVSDANTPGSTTASGSGSAATTSSSSGIAAPTSGLGLSGAVVGAIGLLAVAL